MDKCQQHVVLVTGGSGTLGRHVVGLLQTRASHVTAIRVLDLHEFQNSPGYVSCKPIREYIGDINNEDLMREACKHVTSVIHLATSQDFSPVPNVDKSYYRNIHGTETLLRVCRESGVKNIIFYSSVAVVYGFNEVINGTEDTMATPEHFYFSADGSTLSTAEKLVLHCNDTAMRTICLRPVMPYGEGDERFLGNRIINDYYIPDYQCLDYKDWAYNGNIAWAFICAENTLRDESKNDAPGKALFIGDDTPTQPSLDTSFLETIYEDCGLRPLPVLLYRTCLASCMHILYIILQVLSMFGYKKYRIDIWRFQPMRKKWLINHESAKRLIGYKPIYTGEQALRNTHKYVEWKRNYLSKALMYRNNFMMVLEQTKYLKR